ncbi:DUF4193 family protein [Canibacter sp. lx-72]|uniref:DUF4193 domain-containing protein n=1 Tax=Canibacter zhuwentaonis TaxID=2837491 RepID=UPI001BDCFA02|nr:DUF4193 domain-containing protein [Canibacter zhuwentaonis]MBT1017979.1 DUF4193 family protein [Canibacter zhuwentaonis]MBT1035139.1 DUF4193 family protein [Canibacter zhuwentaonis]
MATDYDAPRKSAEEEVDSIDALKESRASSRSHYIDADDSDNLGFELGGDDLSDFELDVVVLPQQDDEFTCTNCFLVRHQSQLAGEGEIGDICADCVD